MRLNHEQYKLVVTASGAGEGSRNVHLGDFDATTGSIELIADRVSFHVNQIRRYEAGQAQPTLDALINLAKVLHVSLDSLVFGEHARGPYDDFRLRFEALKDFTPSEKKRTRRTTG
jgi:transcriptional regulator with XRE-family HTH domain